MYTSVQMLFCVCYTVDTPFVDIVCDTYSIPSLMKACSVLTNRFVQL